MFSIEMILLFGGREDNGARLGDNGVTMAQFALVSVLYSHLRVVGVTPADEAAVWAVELWPGAGALVTQGPSPARGTGAPGHLISIMMSLESSPAIHGVTARPVVTAAVVLTALAVSPIWTLLLALDREPSSDFILREGSQHPVQW